MDIISAQQVPIDAKSGSDSKIQVGKHWMSNREMRLGTPLSPHVVPLPELFYNLSSIKLTQIRYSIL